uniref:Uncharacterized protein n=1 Tax=Aegilops tauschii subsp. strangulata TaxID=200361 RepID=A0A453SRF2_AEGTS
MTHDAAAEATTTKLLAVLEKPRRRNMYAFACVTLASMTTILTGYSTYIIAIVHGSHLYVTNALARDRLRPLHCRSRLDERRGALHPRGPGPHRHAGRGPRGVHERLHARVHPLLRLDGRPPGPPRHARGRQRLLHGRRARHVPRRKLRGAHGCTLRHQHRHGARPRRRAGLQRRDLAAVHARHALLAARRTYARRFVDRNRIRFDW